MCDVGEMRHEPTTSLTLESKMAERMRQYDTEAQRLEEKQARLEKLRRALAVTESHRARFKLQDEIRAIEEEVRSTSEQEGMINYLLSVVPVIQEYFHDSVAEVGAKRKVASISQHSVMDFFKVPRADEVVKPVSSSNTVRAQSKRVPAHISNDGRQNKITCFVGCTSESKKGTLYKKFMEVSNDGAGDIEYDDDMICKACKVNKIAHEDEAILVCPSCGTSVPYIDTGITSIPFNSSIDYTSFSYKRINHFNEWLAQFQGKERTDIPDAVLADIRREIKISRRSEVKQQTVRGILKKLKYQKYYEHVPQITNTLNGVPPPCMTELQERTLRNCFRQIQNPFAEVCPASRKNFLSYSYCLHKLCQLNGFDAFTSCFPLLKSREKLIEQDRIWSKICKILKWEFIPSI